MCAHIKIYGLELLKFFFSIYPSIAQHFSYINKLHVAHENLEIWIYVFCQCSCRPIQPKSHCSCPHRLSIILNFILIVSENCGLDAMFLLLPPPHRVPVPSSIDYEWFRNVAFVHHLHFIVSKFVCTKDEFQYERKSPSYKKKIKFIVSQIWTHKKGENKSRENLFELFSVNWN